jgi:hypothetical protein
MGALKDRPCALDSEAQLRVNGTRGALGTGTVPLMHVEDTYRLGSARALNGISMTVEPSVWNDGGLGLGLYSGGINGDGEGVGGVNWIGDRPHLTWASQVNASGPGWD